MNGILYGIERYFVDRRLRAAALICFVGGYGRRQTLLVPASVIIERVAEKHCHLGFSQRDDRSRHGLDNERSVAAGMMRTSFLRRYISSGNIHF